MIDKRLKPRSDIEDAMIVVNNDVRRPRRNKACKWGTETAVKGTVTQCQRLKSLRGNQRHVQTYLVSICATDVYFISPIGMQTELMGRQPRGNLAFAADPYCVFYPLYPVCTHLLIYISNIWLSNHLYNDSLTITQTVYFRLHDLVLSPICKQS